MGKCPLNKEASFKNFMSDQDDQKPENAEEPKPKDEKQGDKKELDLEEFKILIVEDYPFIADILSQCLKEIGIGEILKAENGRQGQMKIQTLNSTENMSNIDLVLLDWLMPEMDGKALLTWIREHKSDTIRFLPVIVCSAYTDEPLVVETRDLGANEVVVKPVSAGALAKRIQHIINKPRPFVKSKDFFGPDRRRQVKDFDGEERRKLKPQDLNHSHEKK